MIPTSVLKASGIALATLLAIGVTGKVMYGCGSSSRDRQVEELASRLAQSEKTIEIENGLYATQLVEMRNLRSLIDSTKEECRSLIDQLAASKAELLTTHQVAVKWKSAYEGAVKAHQSDSGPSPTDPTVVRKRVEFERDFGPIAVSGYTLTDPPEGKVSVRQTRPLILTVNVARDRNGKWSSLVTSSEPTMDVGVTLGAVDPGAIPSPSWYQRIWVDLGASVFMDHWVSAGVSYRGDRFSMGVSCFGSESTSGCGLTGGIRLFK